MPMNRSKMEAVGDFVAAVKFVNLTDSLFYVSFIGEEDDLVIIVRPGHKVSGICHYPNNITIRWSDNPKLTNYDKCYLLLITSLIVFCHVTFFPVFDDSFIWESKVSTLVITLIFTMTALYLKSYMTNISPETKLFHTHLIHGEQHFTLHCRRSFLNSFLTKTIQHDLFIEKRPYTPVFTIP